MNLIFSGNVRTLSLSCNVKNVLDSVLSEILARTVTVSYC